MPTDRRRYGQSKEAMALGERIRELRERRGWTQYRLAKESGHSHPYVKYLEEGGVKKPSLDSLMRLSAALDVSLEDLLGSTGLATENVDMDMPVVRRIAALLPALGTIDPEQLLADYADLSPEDQQVIQDVMRAMRKRHPHTAEGDGPTEATPS